MKAAFWLLIVASLGTIVFGIRHVLRKHRERERAEEARAAEFLALAGAAPRAPAPPAAPARTPEAPPPSTAAAPSAPAAPAAPANGLAQQKLLFEAAHKAGEAGEPALAIQLYARLLARFPATAFAAQARGAVEEQKKRLSKASPG